jgi:hypothetical protein
MISHGLAQPQRWGGGYATPRANLRPAPRAVRIPSYRVESVYYVITIYSLVSQYLGVEIPLVAAGSTVLLAAYCCQQLGSHARAVVAPIGLLLACAISFVLIQMVVHGALLSTPIIRTFILWICTMVIVQSLCLREGFLRRCTLVLFAVGLIALPSLKVVSGFAVERAAAGVQLGGNLQNANGLAGWFGFCLVCFALLGLETTRLTSRVGYWLAAAGSLLVVGLAVSRGVLLASAIAIVVGFRGLLRRGFVPLAVLIVFVGIILLSGWLGRIVSLYETRGMEETGRFLLWPYVIDRILASPLIGVGVQNIPTYIPDVAHSISTPHNSFLFFALSSGVAPFILWTLFWIRSGWSVVSNGVSGAHGAFRLSFYLYLFVNFIFGDISIDPWVILAFAVAAGPGAVRVTSRYGVVPIRTGVRRPGSRAPRPAAAPRRSRDYTAHVPHLS